MRPTFLKTVLILGVIAGLAIPGFAAEEEFPAGEQKSVSNEEKTEVTVEKIVAKEEVKSAAAPAETPNAEPPKEETASKNMTGEVAGISPTFIAVTYGQDENTAYEMALNLDSKVKLVGAKDIKDILVGDTVSVSYDEKFQKDEKGNVRINGRHVNVVTLVKPGNRQPEEKEPVVAPPSEEEPQEGSQE